MFHDPGTTVVRKRLSFPSVLVISLAGIVMTTILSASAIAVYGIRLVDKKSDSVIGLVEQAARRLPELQKALPPALADALNDERRPDYIENLDVSVHFGAADPRCGYPRAVVEVENSGDEVVSLLSLRIVGLDENGDPVFERNTWAATPLQIEDEWRGPLLPHETRRFPVHWWRGGKAADLSYEITDIRVWQSHEAEPSTDASTAIEIADAD
ncbi:MAG: hypothetical protein JXQ75_22735 [Phycisphaerae bacterium]|nr:hypothetical protein [Phycisphaerae bacterium]